MNRSKRTVWSLLCTMLILALTGGSASAQPDATEDDYWPFEWSADNFNCNGDGSYTEVWVYAASESATVTLTGVDEYGNDIASMSRIHQSENSGFGLTNLEEFRYADNGNARVVLTIDDGVTNESVTLERLESFDQCEVGIEPPFGFVEGDLTRNDAGDLVVNVANADQYDSVSYRVYGSAITVDKDGADDILTWNDIPDCLVWVEIIATNGDETTYGYADLVDFEQCYEFYSYDGESPIEEVPLSIILNDDGTVTANLEVAGRIGAIEYRMTGSSFEIEGDGVNDIVSHDPIDPCSIGVSASGNGLFAWTHYQSDDCPQHYGAGGGPSEDGSF